MFNNEVVELLNEPLLNSDIKQREGTGSQMLSYLASHHVIDEANRIFGFGEWGTEVISLEQIDKTNYEKAPYKQGEKAKQMISISYLCRLKLTITQGDRKVSYEDTGFGNGVAGNTAYGIGSCIELASKEAVTDALKRCFRYYGNKFGNSLYNKDVHGGANEDEIFLGKKATDKQVGDLVAMMDARDIGTEWLTVALAAEGYALTDIREISQAWFPTAYKVVYEHKLTEIKKAEYADAIELRKNLMKDSSNLKMLRLVFGEAVRLAKEQDDKKMLVELEKLKEEQKAKLKKEEIK